MSRLAVIALVIAVIVALAYMFTLMPGAPYSGSSSDQAGSEDSSETLAEEQDLQAMELNGLDQGLQDIEMELAK